jgi:SAM-dependent MidA family methyltransferase
MGLTTPKVRELTLRSFQDLLCERACMPFDEFIEWALYDSNLGYYRKERNRVGKNFDNDFYTSTTLGSVWGELITEASVQLLGGKNPEEFTFVEIGAEPSSSVLDGIHHPFASHQIVRLGDPFAIPPYSIIYSNEWLDAQPFKRFQFNGEKGVWMEKYVGCNSRSLFECEKELHNVATYPVPSKQRNHYRIDWPSGSLECLSSLLKNHKWQGIFLTFDYGLDLNTILTDRPEGTARAYHRHKISADLLANPTEQDLTCHLCWDSLIACLQKEGFQEISLTSQESFLMKNSQKTIKKILDETKTLDPKMLALKELLHPAHLGHGMQALSAIHFG